MSLEAHSVKSVMSVSGIENTPSVLFALNPSRIGYLRKAFNDDQSKLSIQGINYNVVANGISQYVPIIPMFPS